MSRKLMQDMQPNKQKRSLREAVESKRRTSKNNGGNGRVPGQHRAERSRKRSSYGMWFVVGIVIVFLFFLFSITFSGSKILVYPQTETVSLNNTFTAEKQATTGQLQYEIMTITKEGSKTVEATGESFVEEKASGTITVYNDYSLEDQRLVENTRFRTPEGLVYRIPEAIVVPGQREVNGELQPGSISVEVFADAPGEEYNLEGDVRFDVPGFEGSPQFDSFWAENETSFSGGFRGITQVVSEEDRTAARSEIQGELRQDVMNDVHSQLPEGFALLEDALFIEFAPLTNQTTEEGEVLVREKATVRSVIFDEGQFASHIASQTLEDYSGEDIRIHNIDDLTMTLQDKEAFGETLNGSLSFDIVGEALFVWQYDQVELAQNFTNKRKSDIDRILTSYPAIDRAEIILRPFWRRSFPGEAQEIKIETVIGK